MVVIGFSFHKWLYNSRKINYYKACIQAEREAYSILNNNERRVAMLSLLEFVVTLKKGITENEDTIMKPKKVFFGSRKYNGKINKNVSNYYRTIEEIEQHLNFTLGTIEINGIQYKRTWKHWQDGYFASDYGDIYGRKQGLFLDAYPMKKTGKEKTEDEMYLYFDFHGDDKEVHKVIAELFCERPEGYNPNDYLVHHINKNRHDNRVNNLIFLTKSEHGIIHGVINRGDVEEVNSPEKIRAFLKSYKEM